MAKPSTCDKLGDKQPMKTTSPQPTVKRYKRFKRVPEKDLPAFRLQERDRAILELLATFGMLDTTQIVALLGWRKRSFERLAEKGNINRLRHRLNLLFHARYTEHPRHQYTLSKPRPDLIRMLGNRGADLLFGKGKRAKNYQEEGRSLSGRHIRHTMGVNDFHIALLLALSGHSSATLHQWEQGTAIAVRVKFWNPRSQSTTTRTLTPDGFFVLSDGDDQLPYFLEIDRSSMSHGRIAEEKILAYRELKESGEFEKRFSYKGFRVLFVATESAARANNLRETTQATDPKGDKSRLFLFAHAGAYSLDHPETILQSVWFSPDGALHHLLE